MNVSDITGVHKDSCTGHVPDYFNELASSSLKEKCKSTNFIASSEFKPYHQNKIQQHNNGEICMVACLFPWQDRVRFLYKLLQNVSDVCSKLKLPWVLYYGGLLGYFRNKQIIPWDTDLDILMPLSIKKHLMSLQQNGIIYEDNDVRFYLKNDNENIMAIFLDKQTLLYCDVFFWFDQGNDVKISRDPVGGQRYITIPKNKFYPIRESTMKDVKIYIPNDVEYNLQQRYHNLKENHTFQNGKYMHL